MLLSKLTAALAGAVMFTYPVTKSTVVFSGSDAESMIVVETGTGTILAEDNADEVRPMGHNAKLMTVLAAAEQLESGELTLEETATASPKANAQQGTQIWLEVGDKITVSELLRSVIVGNANDSCVCLAEHISGSVEKHTELLNSMASRLGMEDTHFADCTGLSPETVSTAKDMAKMCCELVKHNDVTEYFTTWMDKLSCKDVELVNNNRLVRSYKGIIGLKVSASEHSGECAIIAAARDDLTICVILLGCDDRDSELSCASRILDTAFVNYRVFKPDIRKDIPKKLTVMNGRKLKIIVKPSYCTGILTTSEFAGNADAAVVLPEYVSAPVRRGQKLGSVTYTCNGDKLLTVDIIAAETVKKIDLGFAVRRALLNLLSFS